MSSLTITSQVRAESTGFLPSCDELLFSKGLKLAPSAHFLSREKPCLASRAHSAPSSLFPPDPPALFHGIGYSALTCRILSVHLSASSPAILPNMPCIPNIQDQSQFSKGPSCFPRWVSLGLEDPAFNSRAWRASA